MNEKLISLAKEASSPEEILKLAKENDIEISMEQAEVIYERLNASGEVSDDELESVAGGCSDNVVQDVKVWFGSLFGK